MASVAVNESTTDVNSNIDINSTSDIESQLLSSQTATIDDVHTYQEQQRLTVEDVLFDGGVGYQQLTACKRSCLFSLSLIKYLVYCCYLVVGSLALIIASSDLDSNFDCQQPLASWLLVFATLGLLSNITNDYHLYRTALTTTTATTTATTNTANNLMLTIVMLLLVVTMLIWLYVGTSWSATTYMARDHEQNTNCNLTFIYFNLAVVTVSHLYVAVRLAFIACS